ncbi:hypothetical protein GCM10010359_37790 [Streptomyces morookaense]|nr:hypothetical protein GCM10010359_37790 [Streptomyces morookaense]
MRRYWSLPRLSLRPVYGAQRTAADRNYGLSARIRLQGRGRGTTEETGVARCRVD